MDFTSIINDVLTTVIIGLITAVGTLFTYGIYAGAQWLKTKASAIKDDSVHKSLMTILDNTETFAADAVESVEATFVKAAKAEGNWNDDSKKEAFKNAYDSVVAKLGSDSVAFLTAQGINVATLVTDKIEALNKWLNSKVE